MSEALSRRSVLRLERWFGEKARDLTWRNTRDPYAIWVSEIMLQQTRVETVERYFSDFLTRFPDLEALATADEDSVLEAWSGLGYYRRARLLHRGAQYVLQAHAGEVPMAVSQLRKIPGIGPYTAGALASIAFDQPEPLVDGNIARVHVRLRAILDVRQQDAGARAHWSFVARVLALGSPRILAQALMELGATVCTPRSPRCAECPLADGCEARSAGLETQLPAPKRRKASPRQEYWALALCWGDRILLERRPNEGLLAGLWCLPLLERAEGSGGRADPGDQVAEVSRWLGAEVRFLESLRDPVKHIFTHRIWILYPWIARISRRPRLRVRLDGRELAWSDDRLRGGIPAVTKKLMLRLR